MLIEPENPVELARELNSLNLEDVLESPRIDMEYHKAHTYCDTLASVWFDFFLEALENITIIQDEKLSAEWEEYFEKVGGKIKLEELISDYHYEPFSSTKEKLLWLKYTLDECFNPYKKELFKHVIDDVVDDNDINNNEKTASWDDVQDKAIRLVENGCYRLLSEDGETAIYEVKGDHDYYQAFIIKDEFKVGDGFAVRENVNKETWACDCPWYMYYGQDITPGNEKYAGRACSHILGIYLQC